MRHIIDISDLTMDEFNELYKLTSNIIDRPEGYTDACRGKVLGSLFYEPSTRTNLSFSTAMMRLGGNVVGILESEFFLSSEGRDTQGYHYDGFQLCGYDRHAQPERGCGKGRFHVF